MEPKTRIAKLEEAVRAGLRLRRTLEDLGEPVSCLMAPRDEVARYDAAMAKLAGEKEKAK